MQVIDTHCHIHEAGADLTGDQFVSSKWAKGGFTDPMQLADRAVATGVEKMICVGCTLRDSQLAIGLAQKHPNCWASIGIHPHEAKDHRDKATQDNFSALATEARVVSIGEIGLDFYYNHSNKADQIAILEYQLDLAQKHHLPVIFHVRDAFDEFWPIYDQYKDLPGVIHSFSSNLRDLEEILSRGLYVGLNGIMTFTKSEEQRAAAKAVPLNRLLLETDAPFLTPAPMRGTICRPEHVVHTAEFLAGLRDEDVSELARQTTQNACNLFLLN